MRVLLLILLVSTCALAEAAPARESCEKFSSYSVSPPLTIEEIEKHEMQKLTAMLKMREDLPKVPFAFMHGEWLNFKSRLRSGDEIVSYSTDEHSWQARAGEAGYAIVRSGCVIAKLVTRQS